jgi:hypothetical protein
LDGYNRWNAIESSMSRQTPFHRALTTLSLLSAVLMVFWPAFASANCCCKRANFFGSPTMVDQADPSCCATNFCSGAEAACTTAVPDCCDQSKDDCQCRASGGDWVQAVRSEQAKSAVSIDIAAVDWLATNSLFVSNEKQTIGGVAPDQFPFLLAQDHCAQKKSVAG